VRSRVEAQARQEGYVVALQAKGKWVAPEHAIISYEFYWKDKRKRDNESLVAACKAWLDGFVDARILIDDDAYHLSIGSVKYQPGKNKTILEIISEI
jgi:hypothetical protein